MAGVTLDAVSQAAGVSKGGLLHHFPNKMALLDGLFDDLIGKLRRGRSTRRCATIRLRMAALPAPIYPASVRRCRTTDDAQGWQSADDRASCPSRNCGCAGGNGWRIAPMNMSAPILRPDACLRGLPPMVCGLQILIKSHDIDAAARQMMRAQSHRPFRSNNRSSERQMNPTMLYAMLVLAIVFEVLGTSAMQAAQHFTRLRADADDGRLLRGRLLSSCPIR